MTLVLSRLMRAPNIHFLSLFFFSLKSKITFYDVTNDLLFLTVNTVGFFNAIWIDIFQHCAFKRVKYIHDA